MKDKIKLVLLFLLWMNSFCHESLASSSAPSDVPRGDVGSPKTEANAGNLHVSCAVGGNTACAYYCRVLQKKNSGRCVHGGWALWKQCECEDKIDYGYRINTLLIDLLQKIGLYRNSNLLRNWILNLFTVKDAQSYPIMDGKRIYELLMIMRPHFKLNGDFYRTLFSSLFKSFPDISTDAVDVAAQKMAALGVNIDNKNKATEVLDEILKQNVNDKSFAYDPTNVETLLDQFLPVFGKDFEINADNSKPSSSTKNLADWGLTDFWLKQRRIPGTAWNLLRNVFLKLWPNKFNTYDNTIKIPLTRKYVMIMLNILTSQPGYSPSDAHLDNIIEKIKTHMKVDDVLPLTNESLARLVNIISNGKVQSNDVLDKGDIILQELDSNKNKKSLSARSLEDETLEPNKPDVTFKLREIPRNDVNLNLKTVKMRRMNENDPTNAEDNDESFIINLAKKNIDKHAKESDNSMEPDLNTHDDVYLNSKALKGKVLNDPNDNYTTDVQDMVDLKARPWKRNLHYDSSAAYDETENYSMQDQGQDDSKYQVALNGRKLQRKSENSPLASSYDEIEPDLEKREVSKRNLDDTDMTPLTENVTELNKKFVIRKLIKDQSDNDAIQTDLNLPGEGRPKSPNLGTLLLDLDNGKGLKNIPMHRNRIIGESTNDNEIITNLQENDILKPKSHYLNVAEPLSEDNIAFNGRPMKRNLHGDTPLLKEEIIPAYTPNGVEQQNEDNVNVHITKRPASTRNSDETVRTTPSENEMKLKPKLHTKPSFTNDDETSAKVNRNVNLNPRLLKGKSNEDEPDILAKDNQNSDLAENDSHLKSKPKNLLREPVFKEKPDSRDHSPGIFSLKPTSEREGHSHPPIELEHYVPLEKENTSEREDHSHPPNELEHYVPLEKENTSKREGHSHPPIELEHYVPLEKENTSEREDHSHPPNELEHYVPLEKENTSKREGHSHPPNELEHYLPLKKINTSEREGHSHPPNELEHYVPLEKENTSKREGYSHPPNELEHYVPLKKINTSEREAHSHPPNKLEHYVPLKKDNVLPKDVPESHLQTKSTKQYLKETEQPQEEPNAEDNSTKNLNEKPAGGAEGNSHSTIKSGPHEPLLKQPVIPKDSIDSENHLKPKREEKESSVTPESIITPDISDNDEALKNKFLTQTKPPQVSESDKALRNKVLDILKPIKKSNVPEKLPETKRLNTIKHKYTTPINNQLHPNDSVGTGSVEQNVQKRGLKQSISKNNFNGGSPIDRKNPRNLHNSLSNQGGSNPKTNEYENPMKNNILGQLRPVSQRPVRKSAIPTFQTPTKSIFPGSSRIKTIPSRRKQNISVSKPQTSSSSLPRNYSLDKPRVKPTGFSAPQAMTSPIGSPQVDFIQLKTPTVLPNVSLDASQPHSTGIPSPQFPPIDTVAPQLESLTKQLPPKKGGSKPKTNEYDNALKNNILKQLRPVSQSSVRKSAIPTFQTPTKLISPSSRRIKTIPSRRKQNISVPKPQTISPSLSRNYSLGKPPVKPTGISAPQVMTSPIGSQHINPIQINKPTTLPNVSHDASQPHLKGIPSPRSTPIDTSNYNFIPSKLYSLKDTPENSASPKQKPARAVNQHVKNPEPNNSLPHKIFEKFAIPKNSVTESFLPRPAVSVNNNSKNPGVKNSSPNTISENALKPKRSPKDSAIGSIQAIPESASKEKIPKESPIHQQETSKPQQQLKHQETPKLSVNPTKSSKTVMLSRTQDYQTGTGSEMSTSDSSKARIPIAAPTTTNQQYNNKNSGNGKGSSSSSRSPSSTSPDKSSPSSSSSSLTRNSIQTQPRMVPVTMKNGKRAYFIAEDEEENDDGEDEYEYVDDDDDDPNVEGPK